jgi:hypothetical protein
VAGEYDGDSNGRPNDGQKKNGKESVAKEMATTGMSFQWKGGGLPARGWG